MLAQGWQLQWRRVQRRLKIVREVYAGRPGGTDDAIDDVLSFFEVVHHLEDWLKNDPSSKITKPEVSQISASTTQKLCADLANGSKHFKLESSRTKDLSTTIARNDATVFPATVAGSAAMGAPTSPPQPAPTAKSAHRFYVASAGAEHDVLELAEAAVDQWRQFLSDRGLVP